MQACQHGSEPSVDVGERGREIVFIAHGDDVLSEVLQRVRVRASVDQALRDERAEGLLDRVRVRRAPLPLADEVESFEEERHDEVVDVLQRAQDRDRLVRDVVAPVIVRGLVAAGHAANVRRVVHAGRWDLTAERRI
ncbi:hypothetical protein RRF57_000241 [Xylaria bambusicola]|uniref:Uncharacterized protein n=1 Tax=Xylaria bambusicola TaxID=326684 RepID=A0AAN7U3A1_9PEZI